MKIWHDDIRLPPEGWVWVRTNDEASLLLSKHADDVDVISLDHDLGLDDQDPLAEDAWLQMGHSPNGTGLDLIDWMIHTECVPSTVIIHTMNAPAGERMVRTLLTARSRHLIPSDTIIIRRPYTHP